MSRPKTTLAYTTIMVQISPRVGNVVILGASLDSLHGKGVKKCVEEFFETNVTSTVNKPNIEGGKYKFKNTMTYDHETHEQMIDDFSGEIEHVMNQHSFKKLGIEKGWNIVEMYFEKRVKRNSGRR